MSQSSTLGCTALWKADIPRLTKQLRTDVSWKLKHVKYDFLLLDNNSEFFSRNGNIGTGFSDIVGMMFTIFLQSATRAQQKRMCGLLENKNKNVRIE